MVHTNFLLIIFELVILLSSFPEYKFNILYKPFQPDKNEPKINENLINSVYGTGNRLKDTVYKSLCNSICKKERRDQCCEGNDINDIKCMDRKYCRNLKRNYDKFFYQIIITTYFSLLIFTMGLMFIIFYYLSRKRFDKDTILITRKQSMINGLVAAILVLFIGLIIPLIVLKVVSIFKKKSMTRLLGGDFKSISSSKLVISVDIKNLERQRKYLILDNENIMNSVHSKESDDLDKVIDTAKKLKILDEYDNSERRI